jgi:hypothetical protein
MVELVEAAVARRRDKRILTYVLNVHTDKLVQTEIGK